MAYLALCLWPLAKGKGISALCDIIKGWPPELCIHSRKAGWWWTFLLCFLFLSSLAWTCKTVRPRCAAESLLDKLIPAGQIRLQQHVGGGGRCSQQVGVQQHHLEGLAGTLLQILETLCHFGHTAVVQLVELTVGGWEVHEWMRRAPWQADKESKRWGREVIHRVQIVFAKSIVWRKSRKWVSAVEFAYVHTLLSWL